MFEPNQIKTRTRTLLCTKTGDQQTYENVKCSVVIDTGCPSVCYDLTVCLDVNSQVCLETVLMMGVVFTD